MASDRMRILEEAGIDAQGALSRLMNNENFYVRMLGKFLEDKTYPSLEEAYASGDANAILHAAHALKGVSSNLGMTALSDQCGQMQHLMEQGGAGEAVDTLMAQIRASYETAVQAARAAVA